MPLSSQLHNSHSLLAKPFHSTSHLSAAATHIPNPSLPLSGPARLPFPSSVSAVVAVLFSLPSSQCQTQTKNTRKYTLSSCEQATDSFSSQGTGVGPVPSQRISTVSSKNGLFFPRYSVFRERITLRGTTCRGINDHCTERHSTLAKHDCRVD